MKLEVLFHSNGQGSSTSWLLHHMYLFQFSNPKFLTIFLSRPNLNTMQKIETTPWKSKLKRTYLLENAFIRYFHFLSMPNNNVAWGSLHNTIPASFSKNISLIPTLDNLDKLTKCIFYLEFWTRAPTSNTSICLWIQRWHYPWSLCSIDVIGAMVLIHTS